MSKNLTDLRTALFDALQAVKDGSLDLDKARVINELGKTLVDTAKVEVDFLRVSDGDSSEFLQVGQERITTAAPSPAWPAGIVGVTRHRIEG